ncbi:MAG TPA: ribonuclease HII [Gemmatimonadales bacterium]|nr:ribonuclease HII [Gemmatimonadales bacterium]
MAAPRPTMDREAAVWADGQLLVGVDEAGRGPLAGPVVAAAVVFSRGAPPISGVRDSKTLPAARRETLAGQIREAALAVGVGGASVREIDELNIRVATALAMRRAVLRVRSCLPVSLSPQILLDGLPMPELGLAHAALVDGDAHCHSIAAAGILAKTVRDRLMRRLASRHAGYGWERNSGYGSAEHVAAIHALGATLHHRRSFRPVSTLGLPTWPSRTPCPDRQTPPAHS